MTAKARAIAAILAVTVLAFVVALLVGQSRPTTYSSSALVDVRALVGDAEAFSSPEKSERELANQLLIAESPAVRDAAGSALGLDPDAADKALSATSVTGTDALKVSYRAASPSDAVKGAETFAKEYIAVSVARQKDALAVQQKVLATALATAQKDAAGQPAAAAALSSARVQTLSERVGDLAGQIAALSGKTPETLIIERPQEPSKPDGTSASTLALYAAAAVLLASAVLWFLLSRLALERREGEE